MDEKKIAASLLFDGNAQDAAEFYVRTFPGSRIDKVQHEPADAGEAGDVLFVELTIYGMPFIAINGPKAEFTEATSFQIFTGDQAETDQLWNAIVGTGGAEGPCGWCTDRFGLSWQIVPRALMNIYANPDRAAVKRAFDAMMEMKKIDIAGLEAALAG